MKVIGVINTVEQLMNVFLASELEMLIVIIIAIIIIIIMLFIIIVIIIDY